MADWKSETQQEKFAASVAAVQAGDSDAAEVLLAAMEPAVIKLANRYGDPQSAEFDDLLQVGRVAVWEAAVNFDASKGASVATHCYNMIRWRIQTAIRKGSQDRVFNSALSLDEEWGDSDRSSLGQAVPDEKAAQPGDAVAIAHDYKVAVRQLSRILNKKTRYVTLRRLRGDKYTDIAKDLGVSRAAVQKRGRDGIRTLRETPSLPSPSLVSRGFVWSCIQWLARRVGPFDFSGAMQSGMLVAEQALHDGEINAKGIISAGGRRRIRREIINITRSTSPGPAGSRPQVPDYGYEDGRTVRKYPRKPPKDKWARYRRRLSAAGLCPRCGKPPEEYRLCNRCRENKRLSYQRCRARHVEQEATA